MIRSYTLVIVTSQGEVRKPLIEVKDREYMEALGKPGDAFDAALMDAISEFAGNYIEHSTTDADGEPTSDDHIGWFIEREMLEPVGAEPDARD